MAGASEKTSEITPEHAVVIPPVPAANSIMAYVEAVATVIGSCHIHSVFEDRECIKIYLNDKKFVDFLVNTGVSILGRRVNVDYAIPRADKLILTNVDPIIPDNILMRFLCFYGTPVSTIIHEKIATNLEYSHIECGTRKIYMNLFKDKKPPSKVSIQYQEACYRFEMSVELYDKRVLEIDSSTTEEGNEEEANEAQEVESVESLKPNIDELNVSQFPQKRSVRHKNPTPAQLAYFNRGKRKNGENSTTYAARRIKSRAAKGWYKNRVNKATKMTSTKRANKLINNRMGSPASRGRRGRKRGSSNVRGAIPTSTPIQNISMNSLSGNENLNPESFQVDQSSPISSKNPGEKQISRSISQYPLSTEELKKLLFQTRCNRAPIQVAYEFLARKNASSAFDELLNQLLEYHDAIEVHSLRSRIRRLVKSLKIARNAKIGE